jgi:hypothetical protein
MGTLEKIKEALKTLRQIDGVGGCWLEAEEGDIVHVYTQVRSFDYDLQGRIFQEYEKLEASFPQVSFEFRTTSLSPSPMAETVF